MSAIPRNDGHMMLANVRSTPREVNLPARRVVRLRGDRRWVVMRCLGGRIWVTQQYDLNDYVLKTGDTFVVTQMGPVVVEALCDSVLQVFPSLASGRFSGDYGRAIFA